MSHYLVTSDSDGSILMSTLSVSKTERKYWFPDYPEVRYREIKWPPKTGRQLSCQPNFHHWTKSSLFNVPLSIQSRRKNDSYIFLISCPSQKKTLSIYFKQKGLFLKCGVAFRAVSHVIFSRGRLQHLILTSLGVQFTTDIFGEMCSWWLEKIRSSTCIASVQR